MEKEYTVVQVVFDITPNKLQPAAITRKVIARNKSEALDKFLLNTNHIKADKKVDPLIYVPEEIEIIK